MKKQARKTLTLLILTMFFLTMIYSVFLKELKGPFIEGDEIGYWTHAATMLGWDWKSALSETFPWYSYGYSLVLMPFLAISSDLEVAYRLAIILNIIFILGSYLISIAIVKKISRLNNIQTIMICFICSLYPAYIFQAQIAWSEIFLIFMIWLSFLMFLYYLENKKVSFCLICTCIVAYCFIIHNRALGILISYIVTMTILVWKKRIPPKHLIVSSICIFIFLCIDGYLKVIFETIERTYYRSGYANANSFSGVFSIILSIFSFEGIKLLFLSFLGKIWYLISSSYGLVIFGVGFLAFQLRGLHFKSRETDDDKMLYFLFIALCIIFTIAISSVYMVNRTGEVLPGDRIRIDPLFYGRYNESVVGILMLLGMIFLVEADFTTIKFIKEKMILFFSCYFISSLILEAQITHFENIYLNTPCVVGIYFYKMFFDNFSILKCTIIVMTFLIVCFIFKKIIKQKGRWLILCGTILSSFFMITAFYEIDEYIIKQQKSIYGQAKIDFYKSLIQYSGDIYIFGDEISKIPLVLMNHEVKRINSFENNVLNNGDIVVIEWKDFESVWKTNKFTLKNRFGNTFIAEFHDEIIYEHDYSLAQNNLLIMPESHIYELDESAYWNAEETLKVVFNLEKSDFICTVKNRCLIPFNNLSINQIPIDIKVNGNYIDTIVIDDNNQEEVSFTITREFLQDGVNVFEFIPQAVWTPSEYGSKDTRMLSFPIEVFEFKEIKR